MCLLALRSCNWLTALVPITIPARLFTAKPESFHRHSDRSHLRHSVILNAAQGNWNLSTSWKYAAMFALSQISVNQNRTNPQSLFIVILTAASRALTAAISVILSF